MTSEIRGKVFQRFLQNRYQTGKRFTEAYVDYFERSQKVTLAGAEDMEGLAPHQRMWLEYALSTNLRGADLIAKLAERRPVKGARYLDIGCGFGGCVVAAQRAGAESAGIETDRERLAFAELNCLDFGIEAGLWERDALDAKLSWDMGRFDLISCNDVAEHVVDARVLLRNLRALLKPGGLAYVEVPNPDAIEFVRSDGHFGLFGITQLPREQARRYHAERFGTAYDVGDYWTLPQYREMFRAAGLHVELVESLYHPTRPLHEWNEQVKLLEEARSRTDAPRIALEAYERFRVRLDEDRAALDEETLRNRYLRAFWTFVAAPE